MYKGILHTHTLSVILFLVLYLVKTILLVAKKEELLNLVVRFTKWPERIISFLFLGTGIYLYLNSGNITWMVHLKIGFVFASIPLAIIGFKKKKPVLAILSVLLLLGAYGLAESNKKAISKIEKPLLDPSLGRVAVGKTLYLSYCSACHGENGNAGLSGAKDLTITALGRKEKMGIISKGKGSMPAFKNLSEEELESIVAYTDQFLVK
jgi:hypothetical protein